MLRDVVHFWIKLQAVGAPELARSKRFLQAWTRHWHRLPTDNADTHHQLLWRKRQCAEKSSLSALLASVCFYIFFFLVVAVALYLTQRTLFRPRKRAAPLPPRPVPKMQAAPPWSAPYRPRKPQFSARHGAAHDAATASYQTRIRRRETCGPAQPPRVSKC
eukprot:IDg13534t1